MDTCTNVGDGSLIDSSNVLLIGDYDVETLPNLYPILHGRRVSARHCNIFAHYYKVLAEVVVPEGYCCVPALLAEMEESGDCWSYGRNPNWFGIESTVDAPLLMKDIV